MLFLLGNSLHDEEVSRLLDKVSFHDQKVMVSLMADFPVQKHYSGFENVRIKMKINIYNKYMQ